MPVAIGEAADLVDTQDTRPAKSSQASLQPARAVLVDFAAFAAARFRRTTPAASPEFTPGSTRIVWKQVGNEWHAVTGPFDLYAVIVKRTGVILRDPSLSDASIPAAVA